jgi:5-formyltetrahydrofolate cyclo-ligase
LAGPGGYKSHGRSGPATLALGATEASIADHSALTAEAEAKAALRRRALALRMQKADPRAGAAVARHALGALTFAPTDIVAGYRAMREELDPMPLMAALHARGIALALPVVITKGAPLSFRRYRPGDALEAGVFGTRHPLPACESVRPTIVLVPLLAFDAEGYRLGYGGGFYDRTLNALRAEGAVLAVGLAYAFQEMPALPRTARDARLDCAVTELGVRRFAGAGAGARA